MDDYITFQSRWEKNATIRSRPRRKLEEHDKNRDYYPRSKQPLCIHPYVIKKGEKAIEYILAQTANRFMHEVAILETEMVNKGALMIANNCFEFCDFSKQLKHDALTVIIDEAYHAYVAIDYLNQISDVVDFNLLTPPKTTSVTAAVAAVKALLPENYHQTFELIAVCISEHVLTKELISIKNDTTVSIFFQNIMKDHVFDEGRHAAMFAYVLQYFWTAMPKEYKDIVGPLLALFLVEYLKKDFEVEYSRVMLKELGFIDEEVNKIISDTYIEPCDKGINENNPVVINLLNLLQRCLILDHELTASAFKKINLLRN